MWRTSKWQYVASVLGLLTRVAIYCRRGVARDACVRKKGRGVRMRRMCAADVCARANLEAQGDARPVILAKARG